MLDNNSKDVPRGAGIDDLLEACGLGDQKSFEILRLSDSEAVVFACPGNAGSVRRIAVSRSNARHVSAVGAEPITRTDEAVAAVAELREANPHQLILYVSSDESPEGSSGVRNILIAGASIALVGGQVDAFTLDIIKNKALIKVPQQSEIGSGTGRLQMSFTLERDSAGVDLCRVAVRPSMQPFGSETPTLRERVGDAYSDALLRSRHPMKLLEILEIAGLDEQAPYLELTLPTTGELGSQSLESLTTRAAWHEGSGGEFAVASKHLTTSRAISYELERRGISAPLIGKNFVVTDEPGSSQLYFLTSSHDTPYTSIKAAGDKRISRLLLESSGVSIAKGRYYGASTEFAAAKDWMAELGRVVVKPVGGTKGKGVTVGVTSEPALRSAWDRAFAASRGAGVLVEEVFVGTEARFTVVGDQCIAVSLRIPPTLVGDGKKTIRELINTKNEVRRLNPHLATRPIILDQGRVAKLREQGLTPASVLGAGEEYIVDHKAGFSTGAESVDITNEIHPSYLEVAARSIMSVPGLPIAGVDIMAHDFSAPADPENYIIVEINSQPGIGAHHFPAHGRARNVAGEIVRLHQIPRHKRRAPAINIVGSASQSNLKSLNVDTSLLAREFSDRGFDITWLSSDYFHASKGNLRTSVWRSFTSLTGKASVFATRSPKVAIHLLEQANVALPRRMKVFKRDLAPTETRNASRALAFIENSVVASLRIGSQMPVRVDWTNRENFMAVWQRLWRGAQKGVIVQELLDGEQLRLLVSHGEVVAAVSGDKDSIRPVPDQVVGEYGSVAVTAAAAFTGLDICEVVLNVIAPNQPRADGNHEVLAVRPAPDLKEYGTVFAGGQRSLARAIVDSHVTALAALEE